MDNSPKNFNSNDLLDNDFIKYEKEYSKEFGKYLFCGLRSFNQNPAVRIEVIEFYADQLSNSRQLDFYKGYKNNLISCTLKYSNAQIDFIKDRISKYEMYNEIFNNIGLEMESVDMAYLDYKHDGMPKQYHPDNFHLCQTVEKKIEYVLSDIQNELKLDKLQLIDIERDIRDSPKEVVFAEFKINVLTNKLQGAAVEIESDLLEFESKPQHESEMDFPLLFHKLRYFNLFKYLESDYDETKTPTKYSHIFHFVEEKMGVNSLSPKKFLNHVNEEGCILSKIHEKNKRYEEKCRPMLIALYSRFCRVYGKDQINTI